MCPQRRRGDEVPSVDGGAGHFVLRTRRRAFDSALCRTHGMSSAAFYTLKAKFGALDVGDARWLKAGGAWSREAGGHTILKDING